MRQFDPELRYVPYYYAYSVIEGEIFFQISPFFPIISAYFYSKLGTLGLAIVPVGATILTAIAVYQLAVLANLPYAKWTLWVTVFATPMLFYSLELWDHTLGTMCALWAVYALAYAIHNQAVHIAVLGGVCLGIGLGQRPELYMFAIAVGLALLLSKVSWKLLIATISGGFLGALPIWWAQWIWVGHPLGMAFAPHLLNYGHHPFIPSSAGYSFLVKVWYLAIGAQSQAYPTILETLLILYGIIFLIYRLHHAETLQGKHLLVPVICIFGGYLLWLGHVMMTFLIVGVLPTLPLLVLAVIYPSVRYDDGKAHFVYRLVSLTAIIYFLLMLALWPSFGGIQWGSRYLLPLYPLLIWLALHNYACYATVGDKSFQKMWQWMALSLVILSAVLQFASVRLLHIQQYKLQAIQQVVQTIPADVVLTDHLFLPVFTAVATEKQFLYIQNRQDIEQLVPRFAAGDLTRISIIPGARKPFSQPLPMLDIPYVLEDFVLEEIDNDTYQIVPIHP